MTDVQSRVPALGGPLGFGDLVIFTQSGEAGADRFKTIKNPKEFRDQMLNTKIGMETPAGGGRAGSRRAGTGRGGAGRNGAGGPVE